MAAPPAGRPVRLVHYVARMGRRRTGGGRRAALILAAALAGSALAGSVLAGCGSAAPVHRAAPRYRRIIPLATFALPPTGAGCGGAVAAPGGGTEIPVTVSRVGTQVAVLVNVCIDGQGPFPFIIDSGASQSVVVSQLADRLHLPYAGSSQAFGGVGCTGTARPRRVARWSVAGLPLDAQVVSGAAIPAMGGPGQPDGLVGSDVMERFGAVRIDFAGQTMTFPGPEGPAATTPTSVQGPTPVPTPPSLLPGGGGAVVPLRVLSGDGVVEVLAQVRLGGGRALPFAVDTGSSQSVIDAATARSVALTPTTVGERQSTVCSTITVPLDHAARWSVGGVPLRAGPVATVSLGPVAEIGFVGLLGSDQLIGFGSIVIDYAGGRLVLGSGTAA